jgi:hypothetical protein
LHPYDVPGRYEVSVTACDDDGACTTSLVHVVDVRNALASIDSMPAPATLDEGDTFSGTATIDVPDNGDTYTLAVTYGDGSLPQEFEVTAADTTVDLNHTYADNGSFAVEIVICDNEGGCAGSETTTVAVKNVPPVLTPVEDFTVAEGETFTRVLANFTDPGFDCPSPTCDPPSLEDFTALIGWGDATGRLGLIAETPGGPGTATTGTLSGTHAYADNGTYRTAFGIWDDDEITATFPETLTITVENAPPSVDTPVITPSPSGEAAAVELAASFTDPGGEDDGPFTCRIDWGDETATDGIVDGMDCLGSHTYPDDSPPGGHPIAVTITDKDGGSASNSVAHTVNNLLPEISKITAGVSGTEATVMVEANDPAGALDPLSYAFDCNNDDEYEVDAGDVNTTTCHFGAYEGTFQIGVQVSDDDGGVTVGSVPVTIVTRLCANDHSGVLRYSDNCRNHESAITLPDDGPLTLCASTSNGMLRLPANGSCANHQTTYVLPEDGPLNVCINRHSLIMRVIDDVNQCSGHEFGVVIAATEIEAAVPQGAR